MGLQLRQEPSRKVRTLLTLAALFALVAQPLYGFVTNVANAESLPQVTVRAAGDEGWSTADTRSNGHIGFTSDAHVAGEGSLRLKTDANPAAGQDKAQFMKPVSVAISDVISKDLAYDTKQISASFAAGLPSYQMEMCLNGLEVCASSGFTTLVYEPYNNEGNAAVLANQWQHWNVGAGKFWSTKPVGSLIPSQGTHQYTLEAIKAEFPNAVVIKVGVNIGSNNPDYDTRVDNFIFNGVLYNFEPVAAPDGLKFSSTNVNNTTVSGCDVATNSLDTVAQWNAKGVAYNYRSWTNAPGSTYNSEATAYVSPNLGTNSHPGAFNQGEGDYWFEVQAIMANGDVSVWSEPCKITHDKTKPAVTMTSPSTQVFTNSTDLVIKATDNKELGKVVANVYKDGVDGVFKPTQAVATGTSFIHTVSLAEFVDGKYSVKYNALDKAGNMSSTGTFTFTIDGTKPTAALIFPTIGESAKSFKVKFDESVNPSEAKNPANYFLENWPGAGGSGDLVGDATVSYDEAATTATVTFTHSNWYVSAEQKWGVKNIHDLAGNEIATTTDYSTPLQAPLFGTITMYEDQNVVAWNWDGAFIDQPTQNSAGGSGASGIKEYSYKLVKDDVVIEDWTTTSNTGYQKLLSDGTYTFSVKAWDKAGNESGAINISFTLDSTAPVLTMETPVLNSDGSYTVRVITNDPNSPVSFYLDGELLSGATPNEDKTIWTVTTPPLDAQTTHTITARSTDNANNVAAEVNKQFTLPPVASTTLGAGVIPSEIIESTANFATIFTQPLTPQAQSRDSDTEVLGAETKNTGTDIVPVAATPQGWKIFGIAWYWIMLAILAIGSIAWWTIAAARRRVAQDV